MTTMTSQIGFAGRVVLGLETPPWDSLYRAVIGFGLMPAYYRVFGEGGSPWKLFVFFLLVLAALRIVPGVLRRVLPFSPEVKTVWAERRALARRYDSYQWRKLFGLGCGWFAYLLVANEDWSGAWFLAIACLASGAVGLAFWCKQSRVLAAQTNSAVPAASASA